jgi:hypothetical protein
MNKKNMHINETKHFSTLKYKIRFFYIIFFKKIKCYVNAPPCKDELSPFDNWQVISLKILFDGDRKSPST